MLIHVLENNVQLWNNRNKGKKDRLTFSAHAHFETFLEAAILALVPVVLVYGAGPTSSARVRQIPPHRTLEEAFATLARELSIVLAGTFVATDYALDMLGFTVRVVIVVWRGRVRLGSRRGLGAHRGGLGGLLGLGRRGSREGRQGGRGDRRPDIFAGASPRHRSGLRRNRHGGHRCGESGSTVVSTCTVLKVLPEFTKGRQTWVSCWSGRFSVQTSLSACRPWCPLVSRCRQCVSLSVCVRTATQPLTVKLAAAATGWVVWRLAVR